MRSTVRSTRTAALALASTAAVVAGAPLGAAAQTAPPSTTPPTAESAADVIRAAAAARKVAAPEAEVLALARQLGSASAARAFLAKSPTEIAAETKEVVTTSGAKPAAMASVAGNCSESLHRYSKQVVVEYMYHVVKTTWCWDAAGNVTSVNAYRTSYGTTLAGQLQGFRWIAEPTVQELGPYLASSYTDKYGVHNYYKGRSRLTGHWAICLVGDWDWLCPREGDGHTVVDVGYGAAVTARSYDS